MYKKSILPLLCSCVFLTLVLSACFNEAQSSFADEFVFEQTVVPGQTASKLNNISYIFNGRTKAENTKLMLGADVIISAANEEYGLKATSPIIIFAKTGGESTIWPGTITLDPDDPFTLGMLFFYESESNLPVWLCAGLELYLLDKNELGRFEFDKNLASQLDIDLGNEWFLEGYFENGLTKEHLALMYGFVKHLDESGKLSELIELYKKKDTSNEAEFIRAAEWKEFSGRELDTTVIYTYFYNQGLNALSEQGNYNFSPAEWTWSKVDDYVKAMDDGILFVKDWFGYSYDKPINVKLLTNSHSTHGAYASEYGDNNIVIYDCIKVHPVHGIAHEATHFLNFQTKEDPNHTFFLEGLAEAVGLLHQNNREEVRRAYVDGISNNPSFNELYVGVANKNAEYDTFEMEACSKINAMHMLAYFDKYDKYNETSYWVQSTDKPSTFRHGYLQSYDTAASFILFLLEKSSKDDMRALTRQPFTDSITNKIYGMSVDELIDEWLYEYLDYDEWKDVLMSYH